jgi:hypothetical protein
MGTLVAFFFLARETLYLANILATLLLAGNLWFLHFSRTAWTNLNADLFAVSGALMLALAVRKGNYLFYAAAGAFAALGLYGYYSGRLLIVFFLAYLPFALLLNRDDHLRRILLGYAVLVAACFVVFLPQIKPTIDNWDAFNRRPGSGRGATTPTWARATGLSSSCGKRSGRGPVLIEDGGVMNRRWRYIPSARLLDMDALFFFTTSPCHSGDGVNHPLVGYVLVLSLRQVFTPVRPMLRGLIVAPSFPVRRPGD